MKNVSDIMTRKVYSVDESTSIRDVHKLMNQQCIQHVIVTGKNQMLTGIISDRDVKKYISPFVGSARETPQDKATLNLKAISIMAKQVTTIHPEDSLKVCTETMLTKNIHALPVTEKKTDRLLGVVTTTDLLKVFLSML